MSWENKIYSVLCESTPHPHFSKRANAIRSEMGDLVRGAGDGPMSAENRTRFQTLQGNLQSISKHQGVATRKDLPPHLRGSRQPGRRKTD